MFHVDHTPESTPAAPLHDVVPLFVNLPRPIRTDADLERAEAQEQAA